MEARVRKPRNSACPSLARCLWTSPSAPIRTMGARWSRTCRRAPRRTPCSRSQGGGRHARRWRAWRKARATHPRPIAEGRSPHVLADRHHRDGKGRVLEVAFDDGRTIRLTAERLRVESPSAEVQGHSPSQKKTITGKESVAIVGIEPVGNYAIKIVFDDGHEPGFLPGTICASSRPETGRLAPPSRCAAGALRITAEPEPGASGRRLAKGAVGQAAGERAGFSLLYALAVVGKESGAWRRWRTGEPRRHGRACPGQARP